jgi:hypothetical protein
MLIRVPFVLPGIGELIWGMDAIKDEYTGSCGGSQNRFLDSFDRKSCKTSVKKCKGDSRGQAELRLEPQDGEAVPELSKVGVGGHKCCFVLDGKSGSKSIGIIQFVSSFDLSGAKAPLRAGFLQLDW